MKWPLSRHTGRMNIGLRGNADSGGPTEGGGGNDTGTDHQRTLYCNMFSAAKKSCV